MGLSKDADDLASRNDHCKEVCSAMAEYCMMIVEDGVKCVRMHNGAQILW